MTQDQLRFSDLAEAQAAVFALYPASVAMPALSGLFAGSTVYFDREAMMVSLVSEIDDRLDPDGAEIEYAPAHEIITFQPIREAVTGRIDPSWDGNNGQILAALDEVTDIYQAAMRAKLAGDGVTDRLEHHLDLDLVGQIDRLRERLIMYEAIRVRLLRRALTSQRDGAERAQLLADLFLDGPEVKQMLMADHDRFNTLT